MNDLVKEYIETGKDLNSICDDKIKENNNQWAFTLFLTGLIWIGHSVIQYKRVEYWKSQVNELKDSVTYKNTVIDMQYKALDSAVYFHEIKNR